MDLSRLDSNTTLINDSADSVSLVTFGSNETVTNAIFGHPVSDLSLVSLPLVSSFLHNNVSVFKCVACVQKFIKDKSEPPLLQTSSSLMSYFKYNSPFLIINRFTKSGEKLEYCKIYFKSLARNLTCYILIFNTDGERKVVVLLNNELKPCVDCFWENTKFRIVGTTGTTSTFGNGLIKVFVLNNNYNSLSDGVEVHYDPQSELCGRNVKVTLPQSNSLVSNLVANNKTYVNKNLAESSLSLNTPFGFFIDEAHEKIPKTKFARNGTIKIFDYAPVSENGLMMICVLLVLREQETRKNKGNNNPTYVKP